MLKLKIRVNGIYMPRIKVRCDEDNNMDLLVMDDQLGWIVVDNNEKLADPALSHTVLEFRDEESWALLPDEMKQTSEDMGWQCTTPGELIEILQYAGVIR